MRALPDPWPVVLALLGGFSAATAAAFQLGARRRLFQVGSSGVAAAGMALVVAAVVMAGPGVTSGGSVASSSIPGGGAQPGLNASPGAGTPSSAPGATTPLGAGPVGGTGTRPGPGARTASVGTAGSTVAPNEPIEVGVLYVKNAQAAVAAVGAKNLVPDLQSGMRALIDDVNAHGGISGHHIVEIEHAIDGTSSDIAGEYQKACSAFTQDNHPFAVLSPGQNDPGFAGCLSRAGVIEVAALLTHEGAADFANNRLLAEPGSINLDRLADAEPRQLAAQGWFANRDDAPPGTDPNAKIGVVVYNDPAFKEAYDNHLAPTFAALGHPVFDHAFVGQTPDQLGSQLPSIILHFQQEGINHVTFMTASGLPPGLFEEASIQQNYKPRYGFSSQDAMGVVIQDLADPKGQLHQSVLMGWFPEADVADYESAQNSQPSQPRCLAFMRAHGIQASDGNSAGIDDYMCDSVWYLRDALSAGGPVFSAASFLAGIDTLGGSYAPAVTFATSMTRSKRDGVARTRQATFADACTCFQYRT